MKVTILDHPLCQHKITLLRNKKTPSTLFRKLIEEVSTLLAVESTKNLLTEIINVETPLELTYGHRLAQMDPAIIPILRSGLGMLNSFLQLLPTAKIGHIGLSRDHSTLIPTQYYQNFPTNLSNRHIFLLDPMLATGKSATEAINQLKIAGALNITLVSIFAVNDGIEYLQKQHNDLHLVTAVIDRKLSAEGYILPGLGDAGDRLFGTL